MLQKSERTFLLPLSPVAPVAFEAETLPSDDDGDGGSRPGGGGDGGCAETTPGAAAAAFPPAPAASGSGVRAASLW